MPNSAKPDFTMCCGTTCNKQVNMQFLETVKAEIQASLELLTEGKPFLGGRRLSNLQHYIQENI